MIDYKTKYIDAKKEIEVLATDIVDENSVKNFVSTVDEKIKDFKPSLMLYGTYNSGKSTLLNAIYGEEEKAKTGDWPETSEITAYEWHGYIIYDTPGIDAPQEHDKLTQEHLDKTEIVLFIVSNDGAFEEDYIYEKISDIVLVGKPIVVILNNKTGLDGDSIELYNALLSINKKLIEIGDRRNIRNIEKKVQVLYVDAQTGLDGKIDNEELLLHESNIQVIEDEIDKLFKKSGAGEVITNLNRYFEQFLDHLIYEVDNKVDNVLVKELEKQISKLSSENLRHYASIKLKMEKDTQYLGNEVKSLLLNSADEQELENFIDKKTNTISNAINNKLENIWNTVYENEEEQISNLNKVNISEKKVKSQGRDIDEDDNISDETKQYFGKAGEKIVEGLGDERLVAKGAKEALLKLREVGVKGFKGKWEKTLGKTADKVGRWAGPAVKVAMAGYSIYGSEKEHSKMIQQKREFTQAAQNEANKLIKELNDEISNELDNSLKLIYNPLIQNKRDTVQEITNQNDEYSIVKNKLTSIKINFI